MAPYTLDINYRLKSEVSATHPCQLCSTRYTELRIKNCSKSTSAIKVATVKNMDNFHYKGKPSCVTAKSTPFTVSKDHKGGHQYVHEECIVRTVVCAAEATSNSEKIKPAALAVIVSEGISQSVSCSVN